MVDAGAGPGTLARAVLAARPECADALRYVAVEVSAAQRDRHPDGVESTDELPTERFDGVIVANELLDNLPFRLAVYDAVWREAFVRADPTGRPVEVLSAPLEPVPSVLPVKATLGARGAARGSSRTLGRRRTPAHPNGVTPRHRLRRPAHR